jgi:hypothetical protein
MVLDTAVFSPLAMPSWVDVPAGAVNHTSVNSDRNALLMRSRRTEMLADQVRALRETCGVVTYLPLQPRRAAPGFIYLLNPLQRGAVTYVRGKRNETLTRTSLFRAG